MKRKKIPYDESEITVSATEQTGLIPALPLSDEETESYETLYPIHKQKGPPPAQNRSGRAFSHRFAADL